MTKDLTNGEILVKEIEEIKDDFNRKQMFSGYYQVDYIEFSCNLKSHLEENNHSYLLDHYCNFCGEFKVHAMRQGEYTYPVNRLDFIDEEGKMPENYNYLHYPDSICESCVKNKYSNSIKSCKKCDIFMVDYKHKTTCNTCKAAEILQGFLQGHLIRKKKIKKSKNKKIKKSKKIKKISKKNKIIKIKIIQGFIQGYKVRQKLKPSILTLNQDCINNILYKIRNQKDIEFFEKIDKIGRNYLDEVSSLLIHYNLDDVYCGYCNKFVEDDKFMWLDNLSELNDYLEFCNLCGHSGMCVYCNQKILNNNLFYCEICDKVSDLANNKEKCCHCLENKDFDYDKIERYKDHSIDKRDYLKKLTFWTSDSILNMNYLKISDIINIPKNIHHNISKITRYLENWWWEIDKENCLCEDCRRRLLLENSDGDSDSDDDNND